MTIIQAATTTYVYYRPYEADAWNLIKTKDEMKVPLEIQKIQIVNLSKNKIYTINKK